MSRTQYPNHLTYCSLPLLSPIMYEVLIEICKLHLGINHVDLIVMQTPAKPTYHSITSPVTTIHIRQYHYGKILSYIVIHCWIELTQDYRTIIIITRQNQRVRVRDRPRTKTPRNKNLSISLSDSSVHSYDM